MSGLGGDRDRILAREIRTEAHDGCKFRVALEGIAHVHVPETSGHAPPQHAAGPEAAMPSCFAGTCATRSPSRKGCHPRVDLGGAHLPPQGILPRAAVDTMVGDLGWSMLNLPDQAQGIAVECVEDPPGSRVWEPGPYPAATCYFISYPQDKKSMYDFIMIHALCSSSASQSPNRRILARGGRWWWTASPDGSCCSTHRVCACGILRPLGCAA